MADRPILFSAPMVRALLEGRKTQTRRVLKSQPRVGEEIIDLGNRHFAIRCMASGDYWSMKQPPHVPGDRLWVRERLERANYGAVGYPANGDWLPNTPWIWQRNSLPSIHMPRWASRLTLLVTDVRVQRLKHISEADALAEGIVPTIDGYALTRAGECWGPTAAKAFETLWNSINGPDAWDANPWVAAISFTVHRANIDQVPA